MRLTFRELDERDLPMLTRWLAEPNVRRLYQKTPVTLADVAAEYGPAVRGHIALHAGTPFAYLQCYRDLAYPEWAAIIRVQDGVTIDLYIGYIGDPAFLHRGLGHAALACCLRRGRLRALSRRAARPYRPRVHQHRGAAVLRGRGVLPDAEVHGGMH